MSSDSESLTKNSRMDSMAQYDENEDALIHSQVAVVEWFNDSCLSWNKINIMR